MKRAGFKAYDIRARYPDEINESFAYRLGKAFVFRYSAEKVMVGFDARLSSPSLFEALSRGILEAGADLLSLGLSGTEEVYFHTAKSGACGGIMITASHNPKDENGFKLVSRGAKPIASGSGLEEIAKRMEQPLPDQERRGEMIDYQNARTDYIEHLLSYLPDSPLKPLSIVANCGNGTAGPIIERLKERLPHHFTLLNCEPDGTFPKGVPNPLIPERRIESQLAIVKEGADLGIAWDGDFDRCFFYDEVGRFVDSSYIIALLAEELFAQASEETLKSATLVSDSRLIWAIGSVAEKWNIPHLITRGGHSPMKAIMQEKNALFGGEASAHYYFQDFYYCDSGMIPWLLLTALMSRKEEPLSQLVAELRERFPCSEELNFRVEHPRALQERLLHHFEREAIDVNWLDGLSLTFKEWRFNLRASNTEPFLRLNIETRGDQALLSEKITLLSHLIEEYSR